MAETAPTTSGSDPTTATLEMPTVEMLETPAELTLNPHESLASQIRADSLQRARPTLEGLEWQQHGRRYVVTDYALTPTTREEVKYGMGKDALGVWGIRNKPKVTEVADMIPRYTVTALDENDGVVGTVTYNYDALDQFFDHERPAADRLSHFKWNEKPTKTAPQPMEVVPVKLEAGKDPFAATMNEKRRLALENLQNVQLTFGGVTEEIVDQFLIKKIDRTHESWVIAWASQTKDRHGNVVSRRTYIDDALPKHMQALAKQFGPELKINFFVPKDEPASEIIDEYAGLTDEEKAWAGWLGTRPSMTHEHATPFQVQGEAVEAPRGPALTLDQAYALFAGNDVYAGEELGKRINSAKDNLNQRQYAETLVEASKEVGTEQILELATGMRDEFRSSMQLIGFRRGQDDHEAATKDLGIGWALLELAKERYEDKQQDQSDDSLATYESVNPFRNTSTGQRRQHEIVARRLGQAFESSMILYALQPVANEIGEPLRIDGQLVTQMKLRTKKKQIMHPDGTPGTADVVEYDRPAFRRLPALIQQDVLDIIQRGQRDKTEHLLPAELTKLGLLLTEGIGQY